MKSWANDFDLNDHGRYPRRRFQSRMRSGACNWPISLKIAANCKNLLVTAFFASLHQGEGVDAPSARGEEFALNCTSRTQDWPGPRRGMKRFETYFTGLIFQDLVHFCPFFRFSSFFGIHFSPIRFCSNFDSRETRKLMSTVCYSSAEPRVRV
jgi:hypothetical protein